MKKTILIIGVVVVAGVVYFVMSPRSADEPEASPSPEVTASATPSVTPKKSPTATPKPSPTSAPAPTPASQSSPSASPSPSPTAEAPAPVVHQVSIQDFKFSPSALTVAKGDTVVFTNLDNVVHTATSLAGPGSFDSGSISAADTWTLNTADLTAGGYEYKCTPHPFMRGSITVQ